MHDTMWQSDRGLVSSIQQHHHKAAISTNVGCELYGDFYGSHTASGGYKITKVRYSVVMKDTNQDELMNQWMYSVKIKSLNLIKLGLKVQQGPVDKIW